MRNCIEYPGHLEPYPGHLRPHLSVFLAETRLRTEACMAEVRGMQERGQRTADSRADRFPVMARRRTQSERVGDCSRASPRQLKPTHSVDLPSIHQSPAGNSYLLLIGEENGKTSVIVYGLRNRKIYQKTLTNSKKTENLKSVCCSYLDEAPFLFFLHEPRANVMGLLAYDVLEDKWKSKAKPKLKGELKPLVDLGTCIACFQRHSDTVEQFNISKNRWKEPIKLLQTVDLPVVVKYDGRALYIFSGNIVQRYDMITERVTASQISEYISMGFGFVLDESVYILSDASLVQYNTQTGSARRSDFPHLQYRPVHTAFVDQGRVFVLITNGEGKYEILSSCNLADWQKVLSFPKRMNLICTEVVEYAQPCPVVPFITFDESLRQQKFKLS